MMFPKSEYSLDFWAKVFGSIEPVDNSFSKESCFVTRSLTLSNGIII